MSLENFVLGLRLSGIGMGLVFLTLIVVMVLIMLLERAFRVKPAKGAGTALTTARPTEAAVAEGADEAAAIVVAIVLEREREGQIHFSEEEIVGEVVMVTSIDSGAGAWRSYGRLKAMQ